MAMTKQVIYYDPSNPTQNDMIGAYVVASDGSLIAASGNSLHTYITNSVTVEATELDIRLLTNADVVTAEQGTSPWVVSASDLDIRDLTHASDSIRLGDGTSLVTVTNVASDYGLDVNLINASVVVTATALDIRALTNADVVTAEQGTSPWVVSATDLDIRNLLYSQDSVQIIDAGGDALAINADGSLNVVVTQSGGNGSIKNSAATVTTTAAEIVATPLAARDEIYIQNNGNQIVYIGFDNSVDSSNGLALEKYSSINFRADASTDIWMIAASGSQDVRILEIAY